MIKSKKFVIILIMMHSSSSSLSLSLASAPRTLLTTSPPLPASSIHHSSHRHHHHYHHCHHHDLHHYPQEIWKVSENIEVGWWEILQKFWTNPVDHVWEILWLEIFGQDSQGVHNEELHILSFFIITLTTIATPCDTTLTSSHITFSTSIIFIISTMIFMMILIHCQIISVDKKDQAI